MPEALAVGCHPHGAVAISQQKSGLEAIGDGGSWEFLQADRPEPLQVTLSIHHNEETVCSLGNSENLLSGSLLRILVESPSIPAIQTVRAANPHVLCVILEQ